MLLDEIKALFDAGFGSVAIAVYIFFKDILPKLAPAYAKLINKHHTREDRLFDALATTNTQNERFAGALDRMCDTLQGMDYRLEKLEDVVS